MFDHSTLVLFMGATFVFLVTPGPAVFYIVARSIDQGRTAGFVSTLGLNTGSLVHVAAAAFGVSAVLMSSEAMSSSACACRARRCVTPSSAWIENSARFI